MRLLESLRVAFRGLAANRLRSLLTMLGIMIGVAAVITLVSLGQSFQTYTNSQFQSLGSNLIFIIPTTPSGPHAKTLKPQPLTYDDELAIASPRAVDGLAAVVPTYGVLAKLVYGGNDVILTVTGTTPAYSDISNWPVQEGQFFEDADVTSAARVAVLGTATVKKLFDPSIDPVGQDIKVNNVLVHVIGVLTEKSGGGGAGADPNEVIIMPIMTALTRLGDEFARTTSGAYRLSAIFAQASSSDTMASVKNQIENILQDRHKIEFQGDEDFQVISEDQILSIINNIMGLLTIFLSLIAAISLVVGGIGVMNIMLVSVTERTREIGLRKAVGARYFDLMTQFLFESITLSVGGGLIGIAISVLAAFAAGKALPSLAVSVSPAAIMLATGVSTAIGVFFGLYPASRAAALNPIEALRYE